MLGRLLIRYGETGRPALTQVVGRQQSVSMNGRDLWEWSGRVAGYLSGLGIGANRLVGLYMSKGIEQVAVILGIIRAGAGFAVINPKIKGPTLSYLFRAARISALFIDRSVMRNMEMLEDFRSAPPMIRWENGPVSNRTGSLSFGGLPVERVDFTSVPSISADVTTNGGDLGCCLFTSGSSGSPKGVVIDRRNLCDRIESEQTAYALGPQDVLLSLLPFSFDVGLNQLLSGLAAGSHLVLLNSWFAADLRRSVSDFGVTGISAVPAVWEPFLRSDQTASLRLRYLTISGGDMAKEDLVRMPHVFPGVDIYKTYGQTETFRTSMLMPDEFASGSDSVGRCIHGVQARIVDEKGRPLRDGKTGVLVHGGKGVMTGYLEECDISPAGVWNMPKKPIRKEIFTGDVATIDSRGFIFLHGRRDDMVKRSGFRIFPKEVENAVKAQGLVKDVAVVAVREKNDARLTAVAVPMKAGMDEAELRRRINRRLPDYMRLNELKTVDRLPLTASAKPDYPALGLLLDKAAPVYRDILRRHPGYVDVAFRLGIVFLGQGKVDDAIGIFRRALASNPEYVPARIELAMTLGYTGMFEDVIDEFNRILEKYAGYADVSYFLGLVYAERNEMTEAVRCLSRAVEINPEYKDAWVSLGLLHSHLKAFDEATVSLETASRIDPGDEDLKTAVNVLKKTLESPKSAAASLQALRHVHSRYPYPVRSDPAFERRFAKRVDAAAVVLLAKDLSEQDRGAAEVIVPLVKDCLIEQPGYPDLHNALGALYVELGRFKDAEGCFEEALRLNEGYLAAEINLFKTFNKQAKWRKALATGRGIVSKGIRYPDVCYEMGVALFNLSSPDEARRWLENALEANPSFADARSLLKRIS